MNDAYGGGDSSRLCPGSRRTGELAFCTRYLPHRRPLATLVRVAASSWQGNRRWGVLSDAIEVPITQSRTLGARIRFRHPHHRAHAGTHWT